MTDVGVLGIAGAATVDRSGTIEPAGSRASVEWWVRAEDRWHRASTDTAVRQGLGDDGVSVETRMRVPGGDIVQRVYAIPHAGRGVIVAEFTNETPIPVVLAVDPGPLELRAPRPPSSAVPTDAGAPDRDQAVFWPLPHTATLRVVTALVAPDGPDHGQLPDPTRLPGRADVARGWRTHLDRACRIVLPDERLAGAISRARRHLLVTTQTDEWARTGPSAPIALRAMALDGWGHHTESRQLLELGLDSVFELPDHGAAALLVALRHHLRLRPDRDLATLLEDRVSDTVGRLAHRARGSRWRRECGTRDDPWVSTWAVAGVRAAADLLGSVGADRAGADTYDLAVTLAARLEPVLDSAPVAGLLAAALGLVPPDGPVVGRAVELAGDDVRDGIVWSEEGPRPLATALLGVSEIRRGEPAGLDRLAGLVRSGEPTGAIPGGGGADDPTGSAALLLLARQAVIDDRDGGPGSSLDLMPLVDETWRGASIEAHALPSSGGPLSFAIRWHGQRPALLWERTEAARPARLWLRGLDPAWFSDAPRGEALLAEESLP